jgi:hypothetical protein
MAMSIKRKGMPALIAFASIHLKSGNFFKEADFRWGFAGMVSVAASR